MPIYIWTAMISYISYTDLDDDRFACTQTLGFELPEGVGGGFNPSPSSFNNPPVQSLMDPGGVNNPPPPEQDIG